jgi:DNA-binding LacI/PurR family transcriptional regulator
MNAQHRPVRAGARLTLDEVARAAGVSRATVSNAYNRPDQLSAEVRARVLETARRLGYTGPDPKARALVRGRTGVVGAVFSEPLDYAFADPAAVLVLRGLAQECRKTHTGLLLLPIDLDDADAQAAVQAAAVDGMVAYSLPDDAPVLRAAQQRGLPLVVIDQPQVRGAAFVGQDDREGARLALDHLLALGHRRIVALGYRLHPERTVGPVDLEGLHASRYRLSRERADGFQQALTRHHLPPETLGIFQVAANTPEAGASAARKLLTGPMPPTAIHTDSDQLAFGVLQAARALGVAVPGQLSVVGTDDVPGAARTVPALTTVKQSFLAKGRRAAQLLTSGTTAAPSTLLPVRLVERASTAPPDPARAGPPGAGAQPRATRRKTSSRSSTP